MDRISWLNFEIDSWQKDGIIDEATARRLRERYPAPAPARKKNLLLTVTTILGITLISLGVISLLAHNWENLSRFTRAVISILPLLAAQVYGLRLILTKDETTSRREGVSVALFFSFALAVSLISQTYHIPGSWQSFLRLMILVTLPLGFILKTVTPPVLALALLPFWLGNFPRDPGVHTLQFWLVWLAGIGYLVYFHKSNRQTGFRSLAAVVSLVFFIGLGMTYPFDLPGLWLIFLSGLATVLILAAEDPFHSRWRRSLIPGEVFGYTILIILFQALCYQTLWKEIFESFQTVRVSADQVDTWTTAELYESLLALGFYFGALFLFYRRFRETPPRSPLLYLFFLVLAGYLLARLGVPHGSFMQILYVGGLNLFALYTGYWFIQDGFHHDSPGRYNLGLFFLAFLVGARFVDSNLDFVTRAFAFLLIGGGILGLNIWFQKRRAEGAPPEKGQSE